MVDHKSVTLARVRRELRDAIKAAEEICGYVNPLLTRFAEEPKADVESLIAYADRLGLPVSVRVGVLKSATEA